MTAFVCIDNFLPYPNVVRSWALQQQYYTAQELTKKYQKETIWPGKRTLQVTELDMGYSNIILSRVCELCAKHFDMTDRIQISSMFQLTSLEDGDSWVHSDYTVNYAGLLYLSPNAPIDSGTTFYNNEETPIDKIGNVYNRLLLYKSTLKHKSTNYFGTTNEDSRLTQVFFISEY